MIEIGLLLLISVSLATMIYFIVYTINHNSYIKKIFRIISETDAGVDLILEDEDKGFLDRLYVSAEQQLTRAGITINPLLFLTITLVIIAVSGFLTEWFIGSVYGMIPGMILSITLIYINLNAFVNRRRIHFNSALAIAITVLVKMMQNGVGFEQALVKSVEVSDSRMFKRIFKKFLQEKATISEEEAFNNMNKYVDSRDLRIFAIAVKIGRQSGGRFSNTLQKVEETITYRKKMQDKIDVVTQESNVGAYIIAAIGVFLFIMLNSTFEGRVLEYYLSNEMARWQITGIVMWVFLGLMINRVISKVKA